MKYTIRRADLSNGSDGAAVLNLLDEYAADPMGGAEPLSQEVKDRLVGELGAFPTSVVFLAFDGSGVPMGLAVCFLGFSTFAAKPLLNLHDFYVAPAHRGEGAGRLLMATIEEFARHRGCCKLTLEVQENNLHARRVYASAGFGQAVYTATSGGSLFYVKPLDETTPAG